MLRWYVVLRSLPWIVTLNFFLFIALLAAGSALVSNFGRPPSGVRIVLTLVTVPLATMFVGEWIHRRIRREALNVPSGMQQPWGGAGTFLDFLDDMSSFGVISRRLVVATIGAMAWAVFALVPLIVGLPVLIVMLCMAFPPFDD